MIPPLVDGLLPTGQHAATWKEIVERFGSTPHRRRLLGEGALRVLRHLRAVGVTEAWLDGSMVTDKERPSDYDLCYAYWQADRTRLDPLLRGPLAFTQNGRQGMRRKYLGDVLPQDSVDGGFVEFWQKDRGVPKGIIKIDMGSLP
jgi:uncharacterized protein DUF6932